MNKEEIEKLIDERLAKAVRERIQSILDDITNLKEAFSGLRDYRKDITKLRQELAVYEGKHKGIEMDLKARAKAFDEFVEEQVKKKGADEFQGVIEAIDRLAKAIQTQPVSTVAPTPKKDEPMEVNIDISRINWKKSKRAGGGTASEYDSWAWAFAYDRQGNLLPESKDLFEATQHYGSVRIGDFVVTLGGDKKNLLNRKKI